MKKRYLCFSDAPQEIAFILKARNCFGTAFDFFWFVFLPNLYFHVLIFWRFQVRNARRGRE